nr:MAG TPA: hypothetical protein [Caudoviricetes sp.]
MFTDTAVSGNCSIIYREGSGLVTLKGATNQRRARFKISFGANIAIPTGGTVGAISLALAINGEPVQATQMIQTPAAVADFIATYNDVITEKLNEILKEEGIV